MEVLKPEQSWKVVVVLDNKDCPYLCFPANYWGCRLREKAGKIPSCDYDQCPLKEEVDER